MSVSYPSPIARRSRPRVAVPVESGFVLILVLPVAMMLIMTALSLVSRSNSAAVASAQESRAQAARMAAEYGFNQLMALVNNHYDSSNNTTFESYLKDQSIDGWSNATYSITYISPSVILPCSTTSSDNKPLTVTVEGKFTVGSTTYQRQINRTLMVCAPPATPPSTKLRVRAIS